MDKMATIEMALKNEETEMAYYLNEAKRSKNPLARTMFSMLAKDEEEHMKRIRGLHEKLVADGSWPTDMPIEVAGTDIKKTLDELVGRTGSAEDHNDDDIAALEKAIAFEANGAKTYTDLAAACDNPMEKSFFVFLAGIEREHHLSLTETLAYLKDPSAWMMEQERAGLDGA